MHWCKKLVFFLLVFYVNITAKTDLNTINCDALRNMHLSQKQIDDFLFHKQKYGDLIDIKELYVIPSFDDDLIRKISLGYYVKAKPYSSLDYDIKLRDKKVKIEFKYDNNGKKENPDHLGFEDKMSFKFKYQDFNHFRLGLSGMKYPGEEILVFDTKSHRFLFNSYSFFGEWKDIGCFKNIIIGNFKIGTGQGLVFNSAFGFGKPLDCMKPITVQDGITPSLSEYKVKLTGLANTITLGPCSLATFIAYNSLDANIKDDKVSSVQRRKKYITQNNINCKDQLQEIVVGGFAQYTHPSDMFEVGFNFVRTMFSKNFDLQNNVGLDYLFKGRFSTNASIYSRLLLGPCHVFFEYARSFKKNIKTIPPHAFIIGHITNIFKNFDWCCCFKKYNPTYYNFYGRGLYVNNGTNCSGIHGCACNEVSLYNAFLLKLTSEIEMKACIDLFAVQHKTYKYDKMRGYDIRWRIIYDFSKYHHMRAEIRHLYKDKIRNGHDKTSRLLIKLDNEIKYDFFTSKTQLQVPFNMLQRLNHFYFCLYECGDIELDDHTDMSIFFSFAKCSDENTVLLREKGNKTWTKINYAYSKIGGKIKYKFVCGIKVNMIISYEKGKRLPGISIDLSYEF